MHDRHAVSHPHRVSSSIAARRSPSATEAAGARAAGRLDQHEADAPAAALLVALHGGGDRGAVDRRVERGRQPLGGEQARDLVAQLGLLGERQRGQQPEADRLAVAVALVAGDGLDRMPNRVAEVEGLAQAGVALVLGHDPQLDARAGEHEVAVGCAALARAHAPPQVAAGDQAGLDHLGPARRELLLRQRGERRRVGEHRRGLVVGADVVLALREVDAGLAAVGGVDLGDQRGRHLHDRHAALVDGGAEARHVPHHAAAERDHVVVVAHAGRGERAQHRARGLHASCARSPGGMRMSRATSPSRSA